MIIIQVAGNLGADPDVRFSPSGQKITTLSVAGHIRRQGKDETVWWRVVIFGDHLDKIIAYLKKGSSVIVFGRMSRAPQIYNDKSGQPQVGQLEMIGQMIEFSPFGKGSTERTGQEQQPASAYGNAPSAPSYGNPPPYSAQPSYGHDSRPPEAPSFAPPSYAPPPSHSQSFEPISSSPYNEPQHHHSTPSDEDHIPF